MSEWGICYVITNLVSVYLLNAGIDFSKECNSLLIMQRRNFARKYVGTETCHYYYYIFKKKFLYMPRRRQTQYARQPFRCTNAAVVINVYEFQKDEKQEKEA